MTTLGAQVISNKPEKLRDTITWLRSLNVFDEIVAIADTNKDRDAWGAKLADKYTTMVIQHQEEAIDAVINLSTTDWMFRIDDDERMGINFKDKVRELIERDVDCYWFPRMWLYKDTSHFLGQLPWYPDYQPRLFRRGSVKGSEGVHVHPIINGKSATEDSINTFHYLLVDTTYEQRLEKCKEYARIMHFTLDEFLSGYGMFYVPEKYGDNFIVSELLEQPVYNLQNALKIGGWMEPNELEWIAEVASKSSNILELGSFLGRSTRVMCDNTSGFVTAVDLWSQENNKLEANFDEVFLKFQEILKTI